MYCNWCLHQHNHLPDLADSYRFTCNWRLHQNDHLSDLADSYRFTCNWRLHQNDHLSDLADCLIRVYMYCNWCLHQHNHLPDLADLLAELVLEQLPLALDDGLHAADALVHGGESLPTLTLQLGDLLVLPPDVRVELRQQVRLNLLQQ